METTFCQSCGMPLQTEQELGTNSDGSKNEEYCAYCFKEGAFTKDITMEEMIRNCAQYVEEFNKDSEVKYTKEQAIEEMKQFFPTLKRWKKTDLIRLTDMIPTNICQSCGMPMAAIDHFGTNSDNSKSEDYCCFCFQKGQFTHSKTMEEVIEENLTYMDGSEKADGYALSREEARVKMKIDLPRLKRWRAHQTTHQEYYKAVNQVIDFINKNLHTPITLSDLASVAHISGFHFHRIFKAVMGESPGDYIQRLRLEKSAFKLQTTRLSITEIAERTGYQSVQALGKAFKKRFKVTPTVFRKQPEEIKAPVYLVKKTLFVA